MDHYDFIVIGGGRAGFAAALKGAERGARVLLLEKTALGGRSSGIHAQARFARIHSIPEEGGLPLIARAREAGEALGERWAARLKEAGVEVWIATARLASGGAVEVDDGRGAKVIHGDSIIIATGSRPEAPPTLPFDGKEILAADDAPAAFDRVPGRALVIGEEREGSETALWLSDLGASRVFLLSAKERLLADQAEFLNQALEAGLKRRKIKLLLCKRIVSIYRSGEGIDVSLDGGVKFTVDAIIQAGGRRGSTDKLGAKEMGLRLGQAGEVLVDERMMSSEAGVYAAGSVLGRPSYESLSEEEGKCAALAALSGGKPFDPFRVPRIIHSVPEIAHIGCDYATAHHRGFRAVEGQCQLDELDGARLQEGEGGFVRLVADKTTGKVIGGQVVANRAADLIAMISLGIRKGLTVDNMKSIACDGSTATRGIVEAARACSEALKKGSVSAGSV